MLITLEPTELPFTIGSKVWLYHNMAGLDKSYHEGVVTGIEVSGFSFYKNTRLITEDKPEHMLSITKLKCRISIFPALNQHLIYYYWLDGSNHFVFLSEQELLESLDKFKKELKSEF